MIKETTEIMIWEKIDGTISERDDSRLKETLDEDAEAREYFEELLKFKELLGGVEEFEPPTALRQRIEGAIDFDRYAARKQSAAPSFFRRFFSLGMDFRIAAAAAAGLLIGVVGYHLVNLDPGTGGSLRDASRGTIGVESGFEIDLDGIRGKVDFREGNEIAVSRVEIASEREIQFYLEYEGRPVEFSALGRADSPLQNISIAGNTIILQNLGDARYEATFRREDGAEAPLRVRIVAGGELLLEKEIRPGRL